MNTIFYYPDMLNEILSILSIEEIRNLFLAADRKLRTNIQTLLKSQVYYEKRVRKFYIESIQNFLQRMENDRMNSMKTYPILDKKLNIFWLSVGFDFTKYQIDISKYSKDLNLNLIQKLLSQLTNDDIQKVLKLYETYSLEEFHIEDFINSHLPRNIRIAARPLSDSFYSQIFDYIEDAQEKFFIEMSYSDGFLLVDCIEKNLKNTNRETYLKSMNQEIQRNMYIFEQIRSTNIKPQ